MTTALKIEANRANAQHSTGPRTEEGKAASSQNARKHGLTAKTLCIQPDDREEFEEMLAAYQTEINPQGPTQQTLFDELVAASWNLRRVRVLEGALDLLDPAFDRLARHKARFERTFHCALKELKALQTDYTLRSWLPRGHCAKTPLLASTEKVLKRTHEIDKVMNKLMASHPFDLPDSAGSRHHQRAAG